MVIYKNPLDDMQFAPISFYRVLFMFYYWKSPCNKINGMIYFTGPNQWEYTSKSMAHKLFLYDAFEKIFASRILCLLFCQNHTQTTPYHGCFCFNINFYCKIRILMFRQKCQIMICMTINLNVSSNEFL